MFVIFNQCDLCRHAKVCRYRESYEVYYSNAAQWMNTSKECQIPKCKYFQKEQDEIQYYQGGGRSNFAFAKNTCHIMK